MTHRQQPKPPLRGVIAALSAPFFLGMAPIFGKLAIQAGTDPFSVAAIRTIVAVALLWGFYLIFFRRYVFIYPAGLMGCVVIGVINGMGSLFYYGGLQVLDASLVQLVNGMYLVFAVLISRLGGQKTDRRTLARVGLAMAGLAMITGLSDQPVVWGGVGLMLGSALMFAGTLILSQYVLYEMPAQTMALYVLTTMGVVVTMVWLTVGEPISAGVFREALPPIVVLGITTALSRLALFAGVKFLGGMQTAVLAILEIVVALLLAGLVLDDNLTLAQWGGVGLLFAGMLLVRQQDILPRGYNPNALIVANLSNVQFQSIAFHRAFGTSAMDNSEGTMGQITTQEMVAIQQMMGASFGGVDPFPIGKSNQLQTELEAALPEDLFETQEVVIPEEVLREARERAERDRSEDD